MKELQLPPGEPQDEGRWCQCCTSLRLSGGKINDENWGAPAGHCQQEIHTRVCQEPTAWAATLHKRTSGSWWTPRGTRGSTVPLQQRTVTFPWRHQEECSQKVKGSDPSTPFHTGEVTAECCVCFCVPQYKTWSYWRESSEVTQKWWRHWSISHMSKG